MTNVKYAKKQIVEEIRHWTSILKKIDEFEIRAMWKNLKSTDNVKVGEKSIKFMSSGNI